MMTNELIVPKIVEAKYDAGHVGRVVLEPMSRGFGHTLGNALRRVLLSSIEGTAVTEAEIAGVKHEYDTLEGVEEDVVDILLNVKGIAVRMDDRQKAELTLRKSGSGTVCAKDLEVGHGVEIVNPDHVIAHLAGNGKLEMTLRVEKGRGYVPVPARRDDEHAQPIGTLLLDASFSPIRRVTYEVENTRVQQRTDLDRLVLELETDGTVEPEETVRRAAVILSEQLSALVTLEGEVMRMQPSKAAELDPVYSLPIDELELPIRSINALKQCSIMFIGDLVQKSEEQLLKDTAKIGIKTLATIKEALAGRNLRLEMTLENWPPKDLAMPAARTMI